jgi:uncharacterized protein
MKPRLLFIVILITFGCSSDRPENLGETEAGQERLNELIRAAESGDARDQYRVGAAFLSMRDEAQALEWFKRAAAQGHREARAHVASELLYGDERDRAEARSMYRALAEEGHQASQARLGFLSKNGVGGEQDLIEAYKWFIIAAETGDAFSESQAKRLRRRLNSAQVAEADERVSAFLEKRERR